MDSILCLVIGGHKYNPMQTPNSTIVLSGDRLGIILPHNELVVVDAADYPIIKEYRWYARKMKHTTYAQANTPEGRTRTTKMHRLIMNAPDGVQVDHEDGNGLNNSKANIRFASATQNHCNQRKTRGNSRFKGVHLDDRNKWAAQIRINGKVKNLGRYESEREAAIAYDTAAIEMHREFARVNFQAA
jgi:hypothetical protein